MGVSALGVLIWYRGYIEERKKAKRLRKQGNRVNIGAIFGMDVGGTLAKVVYFERTTGSEITDTKVATQIDGLQRAANVHNKSNAQGISSSLVKINSSSSLSQLDAPDHQAALQELYEVMENTRTQNSKDSVLLHDVGLSFYSSLLNGRLHFFHFETRNMIRAIDALASNTDIAHNIRTIGCTGGGAHKFANAVDEALDIKFEQMDELGCVVRGMHFALTNIANECYTYRMQSDLPATDESNPNKARERAQSFGLAQAQAAAEQGSKSPKAEQLWQKDVKEYTEKVDIPLNTITGRNQFPYLVVNIGSGVSILKISGPGQHERVSGSSVGGGTYWGLCRLLMKNVQSYEEVLNLAETGDASEVDMLVKDIYGGGYENMSLSGSTVASSFGKLIMKDSPRDDIKQEDLAIALLMMITNNIGQVSYLNAKLHACSKIYFVGSFLRHNQISCRRLAFAIDFWSKGTQEALFVRHEGYFGALGTFLQSAFGTEVDKVLHTYGEGTPDARDAFIKDEKDALFSSTRTRARSVEIGNNRGIFGGRGQALQSKFYV